MTKIDNKRKLDEIVLKKLQDILQENAELLNAYDFKKLYDVASKSLMNMQMYISNLTYLLMAAGINPLKYMDEIPNNYLVHINDLMSIDIPYNIKNIGKHAFRDCKNLETVVISNGVTSIGNHAFSGCSGLTSITIPDSVTSIGSCVFGGCSGLTSVTIGNSVTTIGDYAFDGCSSLTSVTIGNSVTSIDEWAFRNCSGLTSITIPDSVTSIGDSAFEGCKSLESINYLGTKKQLYSIISQFSLYGIPKNCIIHCKDVDVNL